jgi:2-(1,2-epoxy-1,2-dihydrophenyl)acetyl-CoA isomerase
MDRLVAELRRCDEDETVRCVVITGRGKLFCGGGDIESDAQPETPSSPS